MKIVRHRINSIHDLNELDDRDGVEIDLRSKNGQIILAHDPHVGGDSFLEYLELWASSSKRGQLILNPKEDGLEGQVLELLRKYRINNFFFLDLTIPTTIKLVKQGVREIALRISEYESLESALRLAGKVDWAWLDCFSGSAPKLDFVKQIKSNFKVCLVSPELQGFGEESIKDFHSLIPLLDAVCTKRPELWSTASG